MTRAQPVSVAWTGDGQKEVTIPQAYLTPGEADVLDAIMRRAVRTADQAVALRMPDGRIVAVLTKPSVFALLHKIAAIAAQPDYYCAVQQQASDLRSGAEASRYVDVTKILRE